MKKILLLLYACCSNLHAASNDNDPYTTEPYSADYQSDTAENPFQVVIDPLYKTKLSAEIQSPVRKIYKRMGESFKKGDTIIQLDDVIYQSNLKKAEAVLNKAKTEYDGKNQLFNDHVASLFELKEAEANVAIAEADLAIAQRDVNSTKLIAPYNGKVVSLNIEENELPQVGAELAELVYDDTLLADLLVPANLLKQFNVGDTFTINIPEIDHPVEAKIKRIGSVFDPSSSTVKIEAEIDNKDHLLRPGMTGEANFNIDESDKTPNVEEDSYPTDEKYPMQKTEKPVDNMQQTLQKNNQPMKPPLKENEIPQPTPETKPNEKHNQKDDSNSQRLEKKIWNFFD